MCSNSFVYAVLPVGGRFFLGGGLVARLRLQKYNSATPSSLVVVAVLAFAFAHVLLCLCV